VIAARLGRAAGLVTVSLSLGLGACAPLTPVPEGGAAGAAWEARRVALSDLPGWQAVGRLSLQSADQAWHAGLVWEEGDAGYRVRLLGPLGQGAVEIEGDAGGVRLRTARGDTHVASDAEALMREALGWSVPVGGLRYWLLGRDDPGGGAAHPTLDPEGRPLTLTQGGWEVRYLDYLPAEPVSLPARVQLDRGDLHARVVINRWELAAP